MNREWKDISLISGHCRGPPGAHNHKSSTPDFGGWSIERASSGVDDISLNLVGAGGEFTKSVPLNDDEWHHLATTFGSGSKKIFVDGQEVATASQTGSLPVPSTV